MVVYVSLASSAAVLVHISGHKQRENTVYLLFGIQDLVRSTYELALHLFLTAASSCLLLTPLPLIAASQVRHAIYHWAQCCLSYWRQSLRQALWLRLPPHCQLRAKTLPTSSSHKCSASLEGKDQILFNNISSTGLREWSRFSINMCIKSKRMRKTFLLTCPLVFTAVFSLLLFFFLLFTVVCTICEIVCYTTMHYSYPRAFPQND